MIQRKDYLMLQIEAITRLIARIRGMQEDPAQPERELHMQFLQCFEIFQLDEAELLSLTPEELTARIRREELLVRLPETLRLYARSNPDPRFAELAEAVARIVRDRGVIDLKDYF